MNKVSLNNLYISKGLKSLLIILEKNFQVFIEDTNSLNKLFELVVKTNIYDAKELCDFILNIDFKNSTAYLYKAFIAHQLGDYNLAKKSLTFMYKNTNSTINEKINGANILIRLGEFSKVEKIIDNEFNEAKINFHLLEPLMYISLKLAKWEYIDELILLINKEYEKGNFQQVKESPRTHLLWCENEIYNNSVVQAWGKRTFIKKQKNIPLKINPLQGRKIKLAYLSSDFKEHPTSYLINGLLKNHNKNIFEIYAFDSSIEDYSKIRKEIISHFDYHYNILDKSDEEAANLIKNLNIDIIIDLNGPTKDHRMGILLYRVAPLQLSYLGYPGSVATEFIDYIIGDSYTIQKKFLNTYKERVIKIEDTYQVNDYLSKTNFLKKVEKKDYGFKNNQLILGVFNSINKIRKNVWILWMSILTEVKDSVIWLLDPGTHAIKNILKETKRNNIDPKRIVIAKKEIQEEHLNRLQICDLMLDTWPYSGHTSTSDALFAKVPVITKEGRNFTCRVSGGLLKAAGFEELICKNLIEYKDKTIELLKNKNKLNNLKKRIKENVLQSDLFDAKSKTFQIEKALITILQRDSQNLPRVDINMKKTKKKPLFSIVTVCKNRLDHLKQTLPLMYKQKNSEIILVDYSCPQKCGQWANENYPKVKVVKVNDKNEFCLPKGRNKGGSKAQGEYIIFVDADIFLRKDFERWILNNCKDKHFYQSEDYKDTSLAGTVITTKKAFNLLKGYDEAFVGWGGEDDDFYTRLEFKGFTRQTFPKKYIETIDHGDEIRQFGDKKELANTKIQAHKINSMYRRIKYDLLTLLKIEELDFSIREKLMKDVKEEIKKLKEGKEAKIEVTTPPQGLYKLNRKLIYTMR